MRPFTYQRAADVAQAVLAAARDSSAETPAVMAPNQFLAGGTTLIDLMKLDVMRPDRIIDINAIDKIWSRIEVNGDGLRLGALARMSDVENDPAIQRDYPIIAQSLQLAASAQLRNMATLGGNVLQRTRCTYFRDVSYAACNKRTPGSGCAAVEGVNRQHAVLGTSDQCIASYPGDFAQALIALDAEVEIRGSTGSRTLPFKDLHKKTETSPHIETALRPGEMITTFVMRGRPWRRSLYLKIRDRKSYEFALASAAVALDMENGRIRNARIALGGVATVPWRATEAENTLQGQAFDVALAERAAEIAFRDAHAYKHNAYKIPLGKQTLVRALDQAAKMEI